MTDPDPTTPKREGEASRYKILSGDEMDGCEEYQVLVGPDGFKCWITEPEDRNFFRDLAPLVERLEHLESALAAARGESGPEREGE